MNKVDRYFLMIARMGNIKRASEQLHVTQPTLTTAMKKLEDEMSVPLFVRRSKGVELTHYGQLYLQYVEEQHDKHLDLMHKIEDLHQREKGKLKLGVGQAWWELFVCHAIDLYHQTYDRSSLYIEFGNNLSLMQHLIQGDIDLFVGHELDHLKSSLPVVFKPLFQDKEACFVREAHPILICDKQPSCESDYPLIKVTPTHQRYNMLLSSAVKEIKAPVESVEKTQVVFEVDSLSASLDLLRTTNALMPYSEKMTDWMHQRGISLLRVDEKKMGNVGIYYKRKLDDEKATHLIREIVRLSERFQSV